MAFEPIDVNVRKLLSNIKANNLESRIEVYPIAVSNKGGVIEIYGGGIGASIMKVWAKTSEQYVTLVPCSTLNNVIGQRFQGKKCFINVDIEDPEQLML
jgi:FkbM family methyltransferase